MEPIKRYAKKAFELHKQRATVAPGSPDWLRLTQEIAELFRSRGKSATWRDHRQAAAGREQE